MIVVTGAGGHLGRAVVEGLLARLPAERIVASLRDPAKAASLAERGVDVRAGDFADAGQMAAAFKGAGQTLIVSVNQIGEAAHRLHRAAFEAARAAGTRRLLYTSHMGTHAMSPFRDHHAAEAVLAEAGLPFTALRHGFYAESALHLVGKGFETGEIRVPDDGPVSWTARADLAEADAVVLADEGRLDGITPPLAAAEALTMADLAAIASELTGREIRRVVVPDEEWRDATIAGGVPAPLAALLLDMFRDARRGRFSTTDPTLGTLLGRPPRSMRAFLADVLAPPATEPQAGR